MLLLQTQVWYIAEAQKESADLRPSTHLLAPHLAVTLAVRFTHGYIPYTNLFLATGATSTKLTSTSTTSSPTPFHQCRRGIFGF